MTQEHEGTFEQIAKAQNKSIQRVYQVAAEVGFPAPLYRIDKAK